VNARDGRAVEHTLVAGALLDALRRVLHRLEGSGIDWAVSGSSSLALHGIGVVPNDIDLEMDGPDAYRVQSRLADRVVHPVRFVTSERMRSHWGVFEVHAVQVEVMGALQVRRPDGRWSDALDVRRLREDVACGELRVPVLPVAVVRDVYRLLGKTQRAELIDRWLAGERT
jgi:hypothetical protein